MTLSMHEWPRRHRITVDHYHRMADAGLFAHGERVELIEGEIIDMPPMGSRHAAWATRLADLLSVAVRPRAMVRQEKPVRLNDASEPQPDITVVVARDDYYVSRHPAAADVLLLVEVSDTTLRYDLDVKVPLYARSGVREVWVVDLQTETVHFHRDLVNGAYRSISAVQQPDVVTLEALPDTRVNLSPPRGRA
jgi:Uma2 family endonuclease